MLLELNRWIVPPGHQVLLQDVTWTELEQILEELGEHRAARVSYSHGLLEIMTPLPEHEDNKEFISDFVKILLEAVEQNFRSLGSSTFKNEQMAQAVEPDACFYIQNEAAIRGKRRIDLAVDPPPDLAIEIDITARTRFNNYEQLGVPELWRFDGKNLEIYVLQEGRYIPTSQSVQFPQFAVKEFVPKCLEQSKSEGRAPAMKAFRQWVEGQSM